MQNSAASSVVKPVKKKALQKLLVPLPTTSRASSAVVLDPVVSVSPPAPQPDPVLAGKNDVRNLFALTSALEPYQMEVLTAECGTRGIALLQETPGVAAVLMNIIMPGFDGYQTIRAIRVLEDFTCSPIIAVTAKSMKEDREKCLEAATSDYLTKPVEIS